MNKFLVNNIIEVKSLLKTSKINLYFSDIEFEIDGKRIYHMNIWLYGYGKDDSIVLYCVPNNSFVFEHFFR